MSRLWCEVQTPDPWWDEQVSRVATEFFYLPFQENAPGPPLL